MIKVLSVLSLFLSIGTSMLGNYLGRPRFKPYERIIAAFFFALAMVFIWILFQDIPTVSTQQKAAIDTITSSIDTDKKNQVWTFLSSCGLFVLIGILAIGSSIFATIKDREDGWVTIFIALLASIVVFFICVLLFQITKNLPRFGNSWTWNYLTFFLVQTAILIFIWRLLKND